MRTYVFDQAWQREHDRLVALEALYDGATRRHLTGLGVGDGWRCLEVGAGAGAVARWLAEQVGEAGQVLATDLDTRFLDGHHRANLDVLTHNIVTDPLEEASFDLVHARAVLQHLPERKAVLARLFATVKPGGWMLIEDVDFAGPTAAVMAKYVSGPPSAADGYQRIGQAIAAVFAAGGADPDYGSRPPGDLSAAGLSAVGAELHAPLVWGGGGVEFVRGTVEQLAQRLVATGLTTEADIESFLAFSRLPHSHYLPPPMVSAWGRRPLE